MNTIKSNSTFSLLSEQQKTQRLSFEAIRNILGLIPPPEICYSIMDMAKTEDHAPRIREYYDLFAKSFMFGGVHTPVHLTSAVRYTMREAIEHFDESPRIIFQCTCDMILDNLTLTKTELLEHIHDLTFPCDMWIRHDQSRCDSAPGYIDECFAHAAQHTDYDHTIYTKIVKGEKKVVPCGRSMELGKWSHHKLKCKVCSLGSDSNFTIDFTRITTACGECVYTPSRLVLHVANCLQCLQFLPDCPPGCKHARPMTTQARLAHRPDFETQTEKCRQNLLPLVVCAGCGESISEYEFHDKVECTSFIYPVSCFDELRGFAYYRAVMRRLSGNQAQGIADYLLPDGVAEACKSAMESVKVASEKMSHNLDVLRFDYDATKERLAKVMDYEEPIRILTTIACKMYMMLSGPLTATRAVVCITDLFCSFPGLMKQMSNAAMSIAQYAQDMYSWVVKAQADGNEAQTDDGTILNCVRGAMGLFTVIAGWTVFKTVPGDDVIKKIIATAITMGSLSRAAKFGAEALTAVIQAAYRGIYKWKYGVEPIGGIDGDTQDEIMEWAIKVTRFRENYDSVKLRKDLDLRKEITSLFVRGNQLRTKMLRSTLPRETYAYFTSIFRQCSELLSKKEVFGDGQMGSYEEPLLVYFSGQSGVGKTAAVSLLSYALLRQTLGVHESEVESQIYNRNVEQEFWDKYEFQLMVIYDDYNQMIDSVASPNPEHMEIIRTGNIAPFNCHMATLEEKSNTPFASKIVICTSNVKKPKPVSIVCPDALHRRFDLCFEVQKNPNFKAGAAGLDKEFSVFQQYDMRSEDMKLGEPIGYDDMATMVAEAFIDKMQKNKETLESRKSKKNYEFLPVAISPYIKSVEWLSWKEDSEDLVTRGIEGKKMLSTRTVSTAEWINENPDHQMVGEAHEFLSFLQTLLEENRIFLDDTEFSEKKKAQGGLRKHDQEFDITDPDRHLFKKPLTEQELEDLETLGHVVLEHCYRLCQKVKPKPVPKRVIQGTKFMAAGNAAALRETAAIEYVGKLFTENTFADLQLPQKTNYDHFVKWGLMKPGLERFNEDPDVMDSLLPEALNALLDYGFWADDAPLMISTMSVALSNISAPEPIRDLIGIIQAAHHKYFLISKFDSGYLGVKVNLQVRKAQKAFSRFTVNNFVSSCVIRFMMGMALYQAVEWAVNSIIRVKDKIVHGVAESIDEADNALSHKHEGLTEGQFAKHNHYCDECGNLFGHAHTIHTEEESKRYKHLCRVCKKTVRKQTGLTAFVPEIAASGDPNTASVRVRPVVSGNTASAISALSEMASSGDPVTSAPKARNMAVGETLGALGAVAGLFSQSGISAEGLTDPNLKSVISKMSRNCYNVDIQGPINAKCYGFFVRGKLFVTIGHTCKAIMTNSVFSLTNEYTQKSYTIQGDQVKYAYVKGPTGDRDMAMINMGNLVPAHKDIMEFLPTRAEHSGFRKFRGILLRSPGLLGVGMAGDVEAVDRTLTYNDDTDEYTERSYFQYSFETTQGDCGSALFMINKANSRKLVGIHAAGNRSVFGAVTRGYAIPLFKEEIEATMGYFSPLAQSSFKVDANTNVEAIPVLPEGTFLPIGVLDEKPGESTDTKIRPSLIHGKLQEPTTSPAHLKAFVSDEGIWIDPLYQALKKSGEPCKPLHKETLEAATNDFRQVLMKSRRFPEIMSDYEMVAGREGEQYMPPIKRNTSAGYPFSMLSRNGKKHWISPEYVVHPDLQDLVFAREAKAARGERERTYWTDTLKDERRPHAKNKLGKTRAFSNGPVDFTLLFRKYFLGFAASVQEGRIENEISVGTNQFSFDWQRTAQQILKNGDQVIAGDFSNFDGTLHIDILEAILSMINKWYDDEHSVIRWTLWREIVNSVHIVRGNVYGWTHSQPSGCPITAILNSCYNSISMRYVYLRLAKIHAPREASCLSFRKHVSMVSYGDDNALGISTKVPWFNQITISEGYKELGMVYTDESKSGDLVEYRTLADISYLKRTFRWEREVGRMVAPLELNTCIEMSNWVRPGLDANEATLQNMANGLFEIAIHGKEIYEEWADKFAEAAREADVDLVVPTWKEMIHTRLESAAEWQTSYDF